MLNPVNPGLQTRIAQYEIDQQLRFLPYSAINKVWQGILDRDPARNPANVVLNDEDVSNLVESVTDNNFSQSATVIIREGEIACLELIQSTVQFAPNTDLKESMRKDINILKATEPEDVEELARGMALTSAQRDQGIKMPVVDSSKRLDADTYEVVVRAQDASAQKVTFNWKAKERALIVQQAPSVAAPIMAVNAGYSTNMGEFLFPGRTPRKYEDLVNSGALTLQKGEEDVDKLAAQDVLANGMSGTGDINVDTIMGNPMEVLRLLYRAQFLTDEDGKTTVSLQPDLQLDQLAGAGEIKKDITLLGFNMSYGDIGGPYSEIVQPEMARIPLADFESADKNGVKVTRHVRELWIVADAGEDETGPIIVAERLFLKLDSEGNPVMKRDDWAATADPIDVARVANPGMADDQLAAIQNNYRSGTYVVRGASLSDLQKADSGAQIQEGAFVLDGRSQESFAVSAGFSKAPTRDSQTWVPDEKLTAEITEMMNNERLGGNAIDPSALAALKQRAIAKLAQG
jgi:hypothetical protein